MTIFFSMLPGNSIFTESWNHVSWVPRLLLRYFLLSAVCKCDLCQLTGTERYSEWNCTVYWRKLDCSWRKLVGLLMETGRSNDGNWTDYWRILHVLLKETAVYLRKVDGLDTETGWYIDGNWMGNWRKLDGLLMDRVVYWWKQCSRFSSFWGPENAILIVPNPAVSWTPSFLQLIFIDFGG